MSSANALARLTDPEWLEAQATRDALIGAYRQGRADRAVEFIDDLEAWVKKTEFATWALAFQWLAITLRTEMKLPAPTKSPPPKDK